MREEKEGRAFPVIPVLLQGADLTPGFLWALRQRQVFLGSGWAPPFAAARAAAGGHVGRCQLHTRPRPLSPAGLGTDSASAAEPE